MKTLQKSAALSDIPEQLTGYKQFNLMFLWPYIIV